MEEITTFQGTVDYLSTNSDLSSTESAAMLGGMFGAVAGIFSTLAIVAFVLYVLLVIAQWRIFTKAGEKS